VDRGLALFRQTTDKDWSLTDCISVVVAKELGLQQVFTTDHHFTQAGFDILLREHA
jgi:predicted nucleic acid-binding protein